MADSARVTRASQGVNRIMAKLRVSVDSGNYYEAHQMYRTLYFRFSSQRKYDELFDLLHEGAVKFFSVNQTESGIDLSKLYLEILQKSEKNPQEQDMEKVAKLYMEFPIQSPDRASFKNEAIKWSSTGQQFRGHPRFHQILAYFLWRARRYPESRYHFLYSSDGSGCGKMLVDFHTANGFPKEMDLFVVGTVLQFVSLKKHLAAANTLKTYTEKHPSIQRGPPYKSPLLNFVWFLLLAIEQKETLQTFSVLVEQYKPSLQRDPNNLEYLDKIGQNFFGLPPRQPQTNRVSSMLDTFLNGLNEDAGSDISTRLARLGATTSSRMETEDLD